MAMCKSPKKDASYKPGNKLVSNLTNSLKGSLAQDRFKADAVYKQPKPLEHRCRKEAIPQGAASPRRRRAGLTDFGTASNWIFDRQFGDRDGPGKLTEGNGIAVNPTNHEIAVVDSATRRINIYSRDGQFKMSFKTDQGPNSGVPSYPRQVVVNSEGSYFVSDETKWVKQFTAIGEFQEEHPITLPKRRSSEVEALSVVGLAVDNNGHLLLGEINRMYICKQHLGGRFITCFKVTIEPVFLAVTPDNRVIISACHIDSGVQIVDSSGQLLETITGDLLHNLTPGLVTTPARRWYPTGICYRDDFIYICNYEIYCFAIGLHHGGGGRPNEGAAVSACCVGCVTLDVNTPMGLAIDGSDDGDKLKLMAVDENGKCVKMFTLDK